MKTNEEWNTMGDYWRDVKPGMKEQARKRKSENAAIAIKKLSAAGIKGSWKSDTHIVIIRNGHTWDYWPTTGKWSRRMKGAKQRFSRGVNSLLKDIQSKS